MILSYDPAPMAELGDGLCTLGLLGRAVILFFALCFLG